MKNQEYLRGYNSAKESVENIQQMYDSAVGSITDDDFDRGWIKACLDMGAVEIEC